MYALLYAISVEFYSISVQIEAKPVITTNCRVKNAFPWQKKSVDLNQ